MAWNPIQPTDIAVKTPITQQLWQKVSDCLIYLYGLVSGAGGWGTLPPNGGFETDSTGSGVPDRWTVALYPGGISGEYTANPGQGRQSYFFTHPGGVGNGGGSITSDYCEVEPGEYYPVAWQWFTTVTGMKCQVNILQFDNLHNSLATIALWAGTSNPSVWSRAVLTFLTAANVRYVRIQLVGGYTDTNVAGTAYFDDVQLRNQIAGSTDIAYGSIVQSNLKTSTGQVYASFTSVASTTNLTLPGGTFGFYPQVYSWVSNSYAQTFAHIAAGGAATPAYNSAWLTNIGLGGQAASGGNGAMYASQQYVTSSGEVFWIFLLRTKADGSIVAAYAAPDHPCFGNGGKPAVVPHPFLGCYDPTLHDIIVINPDAATVAEIASRGPSGSDAVADRTMLQVIMEDYVPTNEVPPAGAAAPAAPASGGTSAAAPVSPPATGGAVSDIPPTWPAAPITVGLPVGTDWSRMPADSSVTPMQVTVPQPDYVTLATLALATGQAP